MAFDAPPYTHPRGALLQFWMSTDAVVEDLKLYVHKGKMKRKTKVKPEHGSLCCFRWVHHTPAPHVPTPMVRTCVEPHSTDLTAVGLLSETASWCLQDTTRPTSTSRPCSASARAVQQAAQWGRGMGDLIPLPSPHVPGATRGMGRACGEAGAVELTTTSAILYAPFGRPAHAVPAAVPVLCEKGRWNYNTE